MDCALKYNFFISECHKNYYLYVFGEKNGKIIIEQLQARKNLLAHAPHPTRSGSTSTYLCWRSFIKFPVSITSSSFRLYPGCQLFVIKFFQKKRKPVLKVCRQKKRKPTSIRKLRKRNKALARITEEKLQLNEKIYIKYSTEGVESENKRNLIKNQNKIINKIVKIFNCKNKESNKNKSVNEYDDNVKTNKTRVETISPKIVTSQVKSISHLSLSTISINEYGTSHSNGFEESKHDDVPNTREHIDQQTEFTQVISQRKSRLLPSIPVRPKTTNTRQNVSKTEKSHNLKLIPDQINTQSDHQLPILSLPLSKEFIELEQKADNLIYKKNILYSPIHQAKANDYNSIKNEEVIEKRVSLPGPSGHRNSIHDNAHLPRTVHKENVGIEQTYNNRRSNRNQPENKDNTHNESIPNMSSLDDHERKIIIEFCHLLEKSKQLFNGLRELPQYGHKQWQSYFGRTFDVYTKLWKYQQQHRSILDTRYGMKRWQIGEIASKIGQLYYHFYLRTSETAYLSEAFSFYFAIRGRCYYTRSNREDGCELMVKKLRYYARFIVVAILLKRTKLIKDLVAELELQIIQYGRTYDPEDQIEWTAVLEEVRAFLIAEPGLTVVHPENQSIILTISGRINNMCIPPMERTSQMYLSLHDAIIIGSGLHQVKFSELTIDMFRMLQNLEREPAWSSAEEAEESPRCRSSTSAPTGILDNGRRKENPHKYLLFKPSPSQTLIYLSSSCNDLPINGALLIYISADGYHPPANKHPEDYAYDCGGLITTSKSDVYKDSNRDPKGAIPKFKEQQILYPGDLHPFTRKPLFLIVDSDNSYVFQHVAKVFGQPIIILMSPIELPITMSDRRDHGSIFTLFLHNPIAGLCLTSEIFTVTVPDWDKCMVLLDAFMKEASRIIMRVNLDPVFFMFMGDEFLRTLIFRYIFCECTLRIQRNFRARSNLPRSYPPFPDELFEHRELQSIILEMAATVGIKSNFYDSSAPSGPLPSTD